MKTKQLKPFQELHHTDKLLRLDCFGGVKWNIDEHDNPLLECIFTPFEFLDPATGVTDPIPRRQDQFMAGITVGYLPTLFLGQFFQNGRQLPSDKWLPPVQITFELDVSDLSSVIECSLPDIQIDPKSIFIDKRFMEAANRGCIKKLNGVISHSSNIKTNNKIKFNKTPLQQEVFIFEIELIRFYLTNSSHSCKNIFNGSFTNERIKDKVVNEIHEEKYLNQETGAGRFVYRHGYRGVDAPILGRILLDPTGLALKAAQRVHSKIIADRVNSEKTWLGYPRTYFPFEGKTKLKLSGRYLKTSTGYIFLVYRIHSCSGPFPFKSLSYCDEIQPGGNPAPPDAPEAFSNGRPVTTDNQQNDFDPLIGESKSNEPPSAASVELRVELGRREYVGLSGISITREKLRDSTHRSANKLKQADECLINGSTGAPTSGESSAQRQSVNEKTIVPSAITADFYAFIKAVDKMNHNNKNWKIDTILIGESDGEKTSYFPEVLCEKKIKIMRQFSFMDEEKVQRRRYICVQFLVNGRYLYVFEAQRRMRDPRPSAGSPYKEMLPILLLHAPGYEKIESNDFLEVIRQTVIKKTWPIGEDLGVFVRDVQTHGRQADDKTQMQEKQIVEAIKEKIEQLIIRNSE